MCDRGKKKMKWETDLLFDIRTNTDKDDICDPVGYGSPFKEKLKRPNDSEFSKCNHETLQTAISACNPKAKYFLEIGVHRNDGNSSTYTIAKNVDADGFFFGVDLDDKKFLDRSNIKTLKENSCNIETVINWIKSFGVEHLDFIHIDGMHSINQVLNDWEYTKLLRTGGVVALHDTTSHPGPNSLVQALDSSKWEIYSTCSDDYGFTYCILK